MTGPDDITVDDIGGFCPGDHLEALKFFQNGNSYNPAYKVGLGNRSVEDAIARENRYRKSLVAAIPTFLKALEDSNHSVRKARAVSGINRFDYLELIQRCPAFKSKCDEIYADVSDKLEEAAFTRAVDGVAEPVFYQGEECGSKQVYSDSLLSLMLQGRKPEVYRDKNPAAPPQFMAEGGRVEWTVVKAPEVPNA